MHKPLAREFKNDRVLLRTGLRKRITHKTILDRIDGREINGRDRRGEPVVTKPADSFKIYVSNGWLVRIKVYRYDKAFIDELMPSQIEELSKHGGNAQQIELTTDIYHGVRVFEHMKIGYINEWKGTSVIERLEGINAHLAEANSSITIQDIKDIMRMLRGIEKTLERASNPLKRAALEKVSQARVVLGRIENEPSRKIFHITTACNCLVAARFRYGGEKRLTELLERGTKAHLKECALRIARDRYMKGRLTKLFTDLRKLKEETFGIRATWDKDMRIVDILEDLTISNIEEKLREVSSVLKIGKRFLDSAKDEMERGDLKAACSTLRALYYFAKTNKPSYMAEQIERTGDPYLVEGPDPKRTFLAYVSKGAELAYDGYYKNAAYCFEQAVRLIP